MAEAARPLYEPNHPTIEAAYENAPPDVVCEILYGALAMAPRPAVPHGRFTKKLGTRLFGPYDEGVGGPGWGRRGGRRGDKAFNAPRRQAPAPPPDRCVA